LFSLSPIYSNKINLSVHKDLTTRSLPPQICGTDKHSKVICGKVWHSIAFQPHCYLLLFVHFTQSDATSWRV